MACFLPTPTQRSWQEAKLGVRCGCGEQLQQSVFTCSITELRASASRDTATVVEIDLTADDSPEVACSVKEVAAEVLRCKKCKALHCAACGLCTSASGNESAADSHAKACVMKYVHTVSLLVERLRRAQTEQDLLPAPPSRAIPSKAYGHGIFPFHDTEYDSDDDDDDDESPYPNYLPSMGMPMFGGHSKQYPTSGKSKGVLYGGGADDNRIVRQAEHIKRQRLNTRYHTIASLLKDLAASLPRDVMNKSHTGRAAMVVETFDEVLDLSGNAGAGQAKATALKRSIADANKAVQTDMSTEHPLLAQMLVGVGFGDGLHMGERKSAIAKKGEFAGATPLIFGSGDGTKGPSVLHTIMAEQLRSSIMDISKSDQQQQLFGTSLEVLSRVSHHVLLAGFLVLAPETAPAPLCAWTSVSSSVLSSSSCTVHPPANCIYQLLTDLRKQAEVFLKNSNHLSGDAEVLIGDTTEDAEFSAVLGLSRNLDQVCRDVAVGLCKWATLYAACVEALGGESSVDDAVRDTASPGKRMRRTPPSAERSAASSSTRTLSNPTSASNLPAPKLLELALAAAKIGGKDPACALDCGFAKILFSASNHDVTAYERILREEAYNTVEDLRAVHHYRASATASSASMKRHMRVSAEMANLPTLAVNFPSSIIVRQDEASMDYLRALVTGPHDTPYMNGVFLFDIFLPPTYPQVSPNVILLTTGGGSMRFNPNLYAEGKVCLSLLGTWSGPGWEPDVSTLSQVLISVQSQIMNDQPYFNEPSYEGIAGTDNGKRCVAKHNTQIRLGTIRYAMLEHLKKAPLGFERAVQAHFYFKRDELRAQVTQWVAEAKALALYDYEVTRAPAAAKAAYTDALKVELAKFVPAAPVKQAGKKRGRNVAYGGYDAITAQTLPAGFIKSKPLEALADAYTRIAHGSAVASWTASSAFNCFARGLGAMPKSSIQSFIPGYAASADAGASYHQTVKLVDLAAAMEAAAVELFAALDKLVAPEDA